MASQDVRVSLTDAGTRVSFGSLGSGATSMEGRLASVTDSTLSLDVTEVTRVSGDDEPRAGERVTILRGNIASVESRKTDVPRSLLAAGALIGGAFAIRSAIGSADQSGSARRGGGQPGQQ